MKILVFNPGSNSLKFGLIDAPASDPALVRGRKLISGTIEPITSEGQLSFDHPADWKSEKSPVRDQGEAAQRVIEHLTKQPDFSGLDLMACRVVHGGGRFDEPVIADEQVISGIEQFEDIAPLHNVSSIEVMRASAIALAGVRMLAVFDTDFHKTIPEVAWRYGLPFDLANECGIRRYGFHGISHKYLTLRYAELTRTPLDQTNIVTLHLEGGSSACAVRGGKSIDTSMGFTPLEGLMMGTRSGDIDASVVGFLMHKKNVASDQVDRWLTKESGLMGISGISQDTRVLVKHLDNPRAKLALDVFSYRVKKYIGSYLAAVGGASAVVFGGGIGENTPLVRREICEGLDSVGLEFDAGRNQQVIDREGVISRDGSRVQAWVIPTEENLLIAHEAALFLTKRS
jgi:acetate kinase